MAQAQAATATTPTIIVNVPGDLVGAPDAGMIRVEMPTGTTPQQMQSEALRLAKAQVDTSRLGVTGAGQRAGFQLPVAGTLGEEGQSGMGEFMTQLLAAFPQAAALVAQLFPGSREATGMLRSLAASGLGQAGANLVEGKSPGEGVVEEMALGGVLGVPQATGKLAREAAEPMMRHNLFKTTPEEAITARMEDVLPRMALDLRATPTREGVRQMAGHVDEARGALRDASLATAPHMGVAPSAAAIEAMQGARQQLADVEQIRDMLEGVRKHESVRGSGSSMTSVLPGSGAVTTAARAGGVPPRLAQLASPAVAVAKGNPRRRMAIARFLDRPLNLADSDDLGFWTSQIGRALAALYQGMQPVASHEVSESNIRPPSSLPRRRQP